MTDKYKPISSDELNQLIAVKSRSTTSSTNINDYAAYCMSLDDLAGKLIETARLFLERQWQPIETAPDDGSIFLALENGNHFECWWESFPEDEQRWMNHADSEPDPTHWMPLPAGPERNDE